MKFSAEKMTDLVALLEQNTPQNGLNETSVDGLVTFRSTELQARKSVVYEPTLVILGQGKKRCYLGSKEFDYSMGSYLTLFLPMPLEVETVEASEEDPLLMAAIKVDLPRMANILLKIDKVEPLPTKSSADDSSGIQVQALNDDLLDPILKLLRTLDNQAERMVLSDAILEEIYYRIICNDTSGSLLHLLQEAGYLVGYNSPAQFSREFKRYFGMVPSAIAGQVA